MLGSLLLAVMVTLVVPVPPAVAADKPKKIKYVPPEGFAGRTWGELRTSFDRLPAEPLGVGAGFIMPVEKASSFTCVPVAAPGPTISGAIGGCDFQATLLRIRKEYEGGGFY